MSFGVIFHFGLYVIPAYDDLKSAKKRKIQNGSEWYLGRLLEKNTFLPISGYEQTQAFHKTNYGDKLYSDFALEFLTDKEKDFDPDSWMKCVKEAGASYVILTAKHHDGYCLWKTKTAPLYNSADVGCKIDILQKFKESAANHGLKFGIYYSWFEFSKSFTK
jgi:alpha-L-fucosidase